MHILRVCRLLMVDSHEADFGYLYWVLPDSNFYFKLLLETVKLRKGL